MPAYRYRKILCPDATDGVSYRASNVDTGEVLECADVAGLLKRIAADPNRSWKWEVVRADS